MNTKLLRQKILDLAIRGKLTEQKKSDGTTKDLLKQIASNVILSNAKNPGKSKNTPKEIIPLDKSEAPFEIPENWEWVRLGDVCDKLIDGDHNPPKGISDQTEYQMLSSRNVNDNKVVDLENVRYLTKEMFDEENKRTNLTEGDILFTSVGSLGRSCVYDGNGNFCFQRSVTIVHTLIFNKYLKYFFDSDYYQKVIIENATGTAQLGFYLEQMRKSLIAIPPLAEQQRIVTAIENAFAEITEIENNQELLKKHIKQGRQKILDLAIRGKLTQQLKTDGTTKDLLAQMSFPAPTGNLVTSSSKKKGESIEPKQIVPLDKTTAPFEIPSTWEWVRLGDVCSINQSNLLDDNLEVAFVPMTNVAPGYANTFKQDIRKWGEIKKGFTHFANGDVAVAKITPCFENRKSVLFKNLKNGFGAGTTELHILRPLKNVFNSYVLWFVKTDFFIQHGIGNFSGAVGQQRVGKDVLANVLFPLPPLAEQQRIVATIEQAFAEFDAMEKGLQ